VSGRELTAEQVHAWLTAYGQAWERRDAAAFGELFADDVRYHWTPFEEPKQGTGEVRDAFAAAVARQDRISFRFDVLTVDSRVALAHWSCSFDRVGAGYRVRLDGIFQLEFNASGRCSVFREWWHTDEKS
jgi:ketosteroid isomerase-like protein